VAVSSIHQRGSSGLRLRIFRMVRALTSLYLRTLYPRWIHIKAAASAYEKAVELKPDDAATWYSLGLQYQRLADYDKAIAAHKTAVALKPDHCDAWARLVALYALSQDKRREAIEAYMKVKELAAVKGSTCQEYEQTLRPFVVP
jgi:tetratricopeptide (TPR) repeat protein